ncbi:uroporphyrinogen-III synthase [Oceaniglobus trochenteri]|uniref:uroporphyrinogen-III synthase n=1 Tax=Oceaniglobus trochenteri TaxID=2763260 RepID=UPI001CFF7CD3|nr:uroporphyrinogen-III synthase [Oceaniglobus trochenteri]
MTTLLLTRPRAQSLAFGEDCRAAGFAGEIVISPILEIRPVPMTARPPKGAMLVFTSVNGVEQAAAQCDLNGFEGFAVGDRTAGVARAHGMTCHSAGGDLRDLVALLQAEQPRGPLWHLRGAHRAGDLGALLGDHGAGVQDVVVYDQAALPLTDRAQALLAQGGRVIVPLFSPRSAALVSEAAQGATAHLLPIAISAAAAACWAAPGQCRVVEKPDAASMLQGIVGTA